MVLSNKQWLDKMDDIIYAIQNGGGDSQVIEDMLSNMWISSATYNVGDYVLYNNNIWKCLVQNSNIAPSEGTTWTRVNITSEISTLNSNFENKSSFRNLSNTYIGNIDGKNLYCMFGTLTLDSSGFISAQLNELKPIYCIYDVSAMVIKNNIWFNIGSNGKIDIVKNTSINIDATDLNVGNCNCCIKIIYSSIN